MFTYNTHYYFDKGLKIKVSYDFLNYYLWHLKKGTYNTIRIHTPKYRPHISVTLPGVHPEQAVKESAKFAGLKVSFNYTGAIVEGGTWFRNFWLPVECKSATKIKNSLNICEENFLGFHLTLGSNKAEIVESCDQSRKLSELYNKNLITRESFREQMLALKKQ